MTGALVATTATKSSGLYAFDSSSTPFAAGSWLVRVDASQNALAGTRPSPANAAGVADTVDSDGVVQAVGAFVAASVSVVSLGTFGTDTSVDFGFTPRCVVVIGGALFIDGNFNNVHDTGELAVRGAVVDLIDGARVRSTVTDLLGAWRFGAEPNSELLPLHDYIVRIDPTHPTLVGLQPPVGAVDRSTGEWRISVRTGACGDTTTQALAPLGLLASQSLRIGDFVFLDRNGNGKQDASDTPLRDINVCLWAVVSTTALRQVACTTTDSVGEYAFDGDGVSAVGVQRLTDYVVAIDLTQPTVKTAALLPTFANEPGVADGMDSDGVAVDRGGGVLWAALSVRVGNYGYVNKTIDFGLYDCHDTDVRAGLPDAHIVFTGDATADFTRSNGNWRYYQDNPSVLGEFPDVGMPRIVYDADAISGWDMRGIYLAYSPRTDLLFVGIDCFGICGDADGNGDPATILQPQALDLPNLDQSETFSLMLDTNNDGSYDIIVGVPSTRDCSSIECIGAYLYDGQGGISPGFRYSGQRLNFTVSLHCNPSRSCPDIEFTLDGWSAAPGLRTRPFEWRFAFEAFAGSYVDGGIGEDFMGADSPVQARFICPSLAGSEQYNPLPPKVGSCCAVQAYSGCNTQLVQNCACLKRPSCCTTLWDASCIAAVDALDCAGPDRMFSCRNSSTSSTSTATALTTSAGATATATAATTRAMSATATTSRLGTVPTSATFGASMSTAAGTWQTTSSTIASTASSANPTRAPTPSPVAGGAAACCSARASAGCGDAAIEQCVCDR